MTLHESRMSLKRDLPPGMILAVKDGNFYGMFGADALVSAGILGLTLTQCNGSPLCGFPCNEVDTYLAKFVRAGKSVAFAEVVARADGNAYEVVRVVKTGEVVA